MLPKGRTSEEGDCAIRGQEKSAETKQMYRQIGNQGKCKLPLARKMTLLNFDIRKVGVVYDCSEIINQKE